MTKKYTLEEAKAIILREKHTKVMAQRTQFGIFSIITWDNGEVKTATTADELPTDQWEIINHAHYVYDLFNEFRNGLGSLELVYEDFKGQERCFRYGSETELPFNLMMQQRWTVRNLQYDKFGTTTGRMGYGDRRANLPKSVYEPEEHWLKGPITKAEEAGLKTIIVGGRVNGKTKLMEELKLEKKIRTEKEQRYHSEYLGIFKEEDE